MAHVLVLGGGFGGLAAVHRLRELLPPDDEVTLIARDTGFFMGFAKLWELAGTRPLSGSTRPLSNVERLGVRLVTADISAIDADARAVETTAGRIEADALIIALGAGGDPAHRELIAKAGGHDLYDAAALPAAKGALAAFTSGRLVVSLLGGPFKCPPAPYEAALLLDENLRRRGVRDDCEIVVTTMQPATLPVAGPDASAYVAGAFAERGIELRTGHTVTGASHEVVSFDGQPDLAHDLFFGVPAAVAPEVVRASSVAGQGGWIHADVRTLRTSAERVYAIGDCTHIPNAVAALPKAGVFAAGEGVVAAANIAADLHGGPETVFDGLGFCFLEFPDGTAAYVRGDFLAEPRPQVELTERDVATYEAKLAFERERLDAWLPES